MLNFLRRIKPFTSGTTSQLREALLLQGKEDNVELLMDRDTSYKGYRIHSEYIEKDLEKEDSDIIESIRSVPTHYAGLSTLSANVVTHFNAPQIDVDIIPGVVYNPASNSLIISKTYNLGTSNANNISGGADEVWSFQFPLTALSSATIDLTNMTDLILRSGIAPARIKAVQFRNLSTADDPTIPTTSGHTSAAIVVTNKIVASPADIFNLYGTGLQLTLVTGLGGTITSATIANGGSNYPASDYFLAGIVSGAGALGGVISIQTNANGICVNSTIISQGQGYSSGGNFNTVVLGEACIRSGGAWMYFDTTALGFAFVSPTTKNIYISNLDPTNIGSVEVDVIGGTT